MSVYIGTYVLLNNQKMGTSGISDPPIKVCPNHHSVLDSSSNFCSHCGARLVGKEFTKHHRTIFNDFVWWEVEEGITDDVQKHGSLVQPEYAAHRGILISNLSDMSYSGTRPSDSIGTIQITPNQIEASKEEFEERMAIWLNGLKERGYGFTLPFGVVMFSFG